MSVRYNYENSGQKYDYDLKQVVSYSNKEQLSGSLFIPSLGVKYLLTTKNKLQPYLSLNFSKPFLGGKSNGATDSSIQETINNISIWGAEFGFGVEYLFDSNFGLGGEFGFRYINLKYEDSTTSQFYNPDIRNYQTTQIEDKYNFNITPTFSKISLNFYF
jgi:hypothetical protein